jgi:hypothetical protein
MIETRMAKRQTNTTGGAVLPGKGDPGVKETISKDAKAKDAGLTSSASTDPGLKAPDWLTLHISELSDEIKAVWMFAYQEVYTRNRYQRGERPAQALSRLKGYGMLADLTVDGLQDMARELCKSDLGPDGGKNRNHYTVNDRILDEELEKQEVFALVDRKKKHLEALRLAPTLEIIESIYTSEYADQLKKAGLQHVAKTLYDAMIERLNEDRYLNLTNMASRKIFPVGAAYIASGAATSKQIEEVLMKQRSLREAKQREPQVQELKALNTDEYKLFWRGFLGETNTGSLLKAHLKDNAKQLAKVVEADLLILQLQEAMRPKSD